MRNVFESVVLSLYFPLLSIRVMLPWLHTRYENPCIVMNLH